MKTVRVVQRFLADGRMRAGAALTWEVMARIGSCASSVPSRGARGVRSEMNSGDAVDGFLVNCSSNTESGCVCVCVC